MIIFQQISCLLERPDSLLSIHIFTVPNIVGEQQRNEQYVTKDKKKIINRIRDVTTSATL